MNVLILGLTPSPLAPILKEYACNCIETENQIDTKYLQENSIDYIISYRYRYIIEESIIECLEGKIINLHISLLPWNRGADPNLWSFLEDTPKGVTIHYVDEGIDSGDIIVQKEVEFKPQGETLATTYKRLNDELIQLFSDKWLQIKHGNVKRIKQASGGSFHKLRDKEKYKHLFNKKGWDTEVRELTGKAITNQTIQKRENDY